MALLLILPRHSCAILYERTVEWAQASFRYVYTAIAVLLLAVRLFTPTAAGDFKLKRWHRIEAGAPYSSVPAAAFLFYPAPRLRDWLALCARAAAVIQIDPLSFRAFPARESKLDK